MSISHSRKIHQDYLLNLIFPEETSNKLKTFTPEECNLAKGRRKEVVKTYHKKDFSWPDASEEETRKPKSLEVKNNESLSPYKEGTKGVPFDLYIKPNPILRVNPRASQTPFEHLPDERFRDVQRTRPRIAVSPAVLIDDVEDQKVRDLIISDTYQSEKSKAEREVKAAFNRSLAKKAHLGQTFAAPRPVDLPKWKDPVVPLELRRDSVTWYRQSQSTSFDSNQEFWMRRCGRNNNNNLFNYIVL